MPLPSLPVSRGAWPPASAHTAVARKNRFFLTTRAARSSKRLRGKLSGVGAARGRGAWARRVGASRFAMRGWHPVGGEPGTVARTAVGDRCGAVQCRCAMPLCNAKGPLRNRERRAEYRARGFGGLFAEVAAARSIRPEFAVATVKGERRRVSSDDAARRRRSERRAWAGPAPCTDRLVCSNGSIASTFRADEPRRKCSLGPGRAGRLESFPPMADSYLAAATRAPRRSACQLAPTVGFTTSVRTPAHAPTHTGA
jgi:hypothetical protein